MREDQSLPQTRSGGEGEMGQKGGGHHSPSFKSQKSQFKQVLYSVKN